jgi:hypothetical protein
MTTMFAGLGGGEGVGAWAIAVRWALNASENLRARWPFPKTTNFGILFFF